MYLFLALHLQSKSTSYASSRGGITSRLRVTFCAFLEIQTGKENISPQGPIPSVRLAPRMDHR
jgi:hypothetical protein